MLEKLFGMQMVRFLFVGGCSTAFDFMIYMGGIRILPTVPAKIISMISASALSYFFNKHYTFEDNQKSHAQIVRFYFVFLLNLISNVWVNQMIFQLSGNRIIGFICGTLAGLSVNYIGQKWFVFS